MKKISIKLKMTLWYSLFMLFLVVFMLIFIFSMSNNTTKTSVQNNLRNIVVNCIFEIDVEDGILEPDDDLKLFNNGVYLQIFDENGVFLFGNRPDSLPDDISFSHNDMRTIESESETWYVYDFENIAEHDIPVLLRGAISRSEYETTLGNLVQLSLIILPLILLISAGGGYWLAGRAFRPVEKIRKTAEEISDSQNLSKRIQLGTGKDEIYSLAKTFDHMFDQLEKSFEAEKQFTSDAAHELRTPTSVIMSQSEFGLENAGTLDEAKESLSIILKQTKKMSELISQLLTLARTDEKKQNIQKERLNLSELTEAVAEEQKSLVHSKNIKFHLDIQPDLYTYGDETLLMRLLINLISNGITYGKENGNLWIQEFQENNNKIIIKITDDGIGIEKEKIDKIWQRFYQADPSRSSQNHTGTGLGLSMAKWIADIHGGLLSVTSKFGEGSTFTVELPKM